MVRHLAAISLVALMGSGCASTKGRFAIGGLGGMAVGAAGGAALSPNTESRLLNALVFGLVGAVAGGTVGVLTGSDTPPTQAELKARELTLTGPGRDYVVVPQAELPPFVRDRVQPLVIEEYTERDHISDEGTLHEPHRAYRIRRPVELSANPVALPSPTPQKRPQK